MKASRFSTRHLRSETAPASEDAVRALQLEKLRAGLRQVLKSNPFWRGRLHDVAGWGDFERLPMTT